MKAPLSWLRESAAVPDDPATVATRLAACGFEVAGVDGETIDVEVTANRPDCLSVYGLAREAATAFDVALAPPPGGDLPPTEPTGTVPVTIDDAGCGRYALALADVRIGPSPRWLVDRLAAAGVRPISNVVDITNYVMLEIGQPMHAFDAATLAGPEIRVRLARPGETLVTLDGQSRELDASMLVIADRDRATALAGVMGGAASEVSNRTTRIALESAWFDPAAVRTTSRRLGLKTEASTRFERGTDPWGPTRGLARALSLFEQTGAGQRVGPMVDVWPSPAAPPTVVLRRARLASLLGDQVPDQDVIRILSALGFLVAPETAGWRVHVPTFRVDVHREVDLIEEVGRHWGFDRIPATFPALAELPRPSVAGLDLGRRLRRVLAGVGLQEAATFTFLGREAAEPFARPGIGLVDIANPLSENFSVLRPSLMVGLVDAVVYNRRRGQESVNLFEIGAAFDARGEARRVAWVLTGPREEHWSTPAASADVYDVLGIAELLAEAVGTEIEARAATDAPWFVPGRAAVLQTTGRDGTARVGACGQVLPAIVEARGLPRGEVVVAGELDLEALVGAARPAASHITALPRHPSVVRDVSLFVDERLPAAEVRGTIWAHAPDTLVAVREFDRYRGKGVPEGRISLSWRLTFRAPDRTLTDHEVQRAIEALVTAIGAAHGATLRSAAGPSPTE
ncbi:MAG TPA: phenylalanine--tRNA ligase subunit beta [Vicinamibacterales bacterium]|nr:phenylalanine--tRNA ligase subunit beta [Vicinamibacterales bacterium]